MNESKLEQLQQAASQDDPDALLKLALYSMEIDEDDVGFKLFFRAARTHNLAEAWFNLGDCYMQGRGVEQDVKEAVTCYGQVFDADFTDQDLMSMASDAILAAYDCLGDTAVAGLRDVVDKAVEFSVREPQLYGSKSYGSNVINQFISKPTLSSISERGFLVEGADFCGAFL